ncbi:DUF3127 domain-containing protein [Membranicola marinus]|uniref:DUF3127 domain-containing protein n=1 Tax=Membranihabitans marinus TaxID=1227546 RepID=A0A953L820_9BACT|nr:DUF3127 domain-containing protein [Membranihabitans marinus]MBY5957225.1 DUF3127 domain-containing protein [Membranihabitans marinus]
MASFEISGKLFKKFETEQKTQSFSAREFVLEVNDNNYMQLIKFQLTQDRCGLLDPFEEGSEVKVHFDLRGREWNGKYFTNLNAWKLEAHQPGNTGGFPEEEDFVFNDEPPEINQNQPTPDDDLPF